VKVRKIVRLPAKHTSLRGIIDLLFPATMPISQTTEKSNTVVAMAVHDDPFPGHMPSEAR
jgi:hypothetical protein